MQRQNGDELLAPALETSVQRNVVAGILALRGGNRRNGAGGVVVDEVVAVVVLGEQASFLVDKVGSNGVGQQVLGILATVLQDVIDERHGHVAVSTRMDAIEFIGPAGGAVEDEAQIDNLCALVAGTHQALGNAHLVFDRVAAPDVDKVGADHIARIDDNVRICNVRCIELGVEWTIVKRDRRHRVRAAVQVGEACGHE